MDSIGELVSQIQKGDRKSIAKAITLVESKKPEDRELTKSLLSSLPTQSENTLRIGISGPPGVGKSTFIEAIGQKIIEEKKHLAILAVDPSSSITGGSILGDKTRMDILSKSDETFIRPSPSSGNLGGVGHATKDSVQILEAAGFSVILIETLGVGQAEIDVLDMTDIYLVLLSPGGGDELQGIKKGIIELADILIVNKADGNLEATAKSTVLDYKNALKLQKGRHPKWSVPVLPMSAIESTGIDDVWNEILKLQNHLYENDIFSKNRSSQDKKWLKKKKKNLIISMMESQDEILEKIEQNIIETDKQLLKKFSLWIKSIFKSRNS
jgi:LAO/AO transport system kinase